MKRVRIIGLTVLACIGLAIYSYYPIHATDQTLQSDTQLTVVFDLGGVLIETNKKSALWQLGPRIVFSYLIRNRSINLMHTQFYNTLHKIHQTDTNPYGAKDPDGNYLPHLLTDWLLGEQPNSQLLNKVHNAIEQHPEWFTNKQEQHLIASIAQLTFNPENLVKSCQPIPEMVEFARQCKQKKYRLYVLSNWDAESFALLAKKYPELFDLFDNIIVSGQVHRVKPDPEMFALITKKVPAHTCIFIDDQQENIDVAQKAGMHGILATPRRALIGHTPDVHKIKAEFANLEKACINTN